MTVRKLINWQLFLILLLVSVVANIAVLRYALSLAALRTTELPAPPFVAILAQIVQATVFSAVAIFPGLLMVVPIADILTAFIRTFGDWSLQMEVRLLRRQPKLYKQAASPLRAGHRKIRATVLLDLA